MTADEQTALADLDARLSALETKVAAAEQLAAKGAQPTGNSIARTDQDFRSGTARDSVSGDGAPDRRP